MQEVKDKIGRFGESKFSHLVAKEGEEDVKVADTVATSAATAANWSIIAEHSTFKLARTYVGNYSNIMTTPFFKYSKWQNLQL